MKILFLNTWHSRCSNELAAFIKQERQSTNIFCFQEADPTARIQFRLLLPGYSEHVHDKPFEGRPRFAIATYVKEPLVVSASRVLLEDVPDVGVALMTRIQAGADAVTVVNAHGISFPDNDDKLDTAGRIKQSQVILDALEATDGHAIVGGDFNLLPESNSIRMFDQAGYQDLIGTYHIPTTRNKLAWERFPDKIQYYADYAFATPGVRIHRFAVPQLEVSDHLPLIVEFDLQHAKQEQYRTANTRLAYDHQ